MIDRIDVNQFINKQFGFYKTLEFSHFNNYKKSREPMFKCECKCGKIKNVGLWGLKSGKTKSCGCSRVIAAIQNINKKGPNIIYNIYKRGATKRNLVFEITTEEFENFLHHKCHYCGSQPINKYFSFNKHGTFIYNGIDRMDNSLGYTLENCISCCKRCNTAKSKLNYDEFIKLIIDVKTHLNL